MLNGMHLYQLLSFHTYLRNPPCPLQQETTIDFQLTLFMVVEVDQVCPACAQKTVPSFHFPSRRIANPPQAGKTEHPCENNL
jgi:hypothetical protein